MELGLLPSQHKVRRAGLLRTWIPFGRCPDASQTAPATAWPSRGSEVGREEHVSREEAQRSGALAGVRGEGVLDERKKGKEEPAVRDGEGMTLSRLRLCWLR